MDGSGDDNVTFSDGGGSYISPMSSQHHLGSYNPHTGGFSTSSSTRNSPFEMAPNRMQQPISPNQIRGQSNQGQGQGQSLSPGDAASAYYGSNSGFNSNNNLNTIQGQLGGSYLSNNSLHNSQDIYGTSNTYDSNFSGSLSSNISRSNSQNGNNSMDHQSLRTAGMNAGFTQPNMHPQDWQGMRMGSHDSQGDSFMQNPYNNDSYTYSNGMMIAGGMNQQGGMRSGSNNRFAGSQLSQMGSGGKASVSSPIGTGGSNAQGRALNKMLLEILR